MPYKICEVCSKETYKKPAEYAKARFCSYACKYQDQRNQSPEKHGRWQGGDREKVCVGCQKAFNWHELKVNGKRLPLTTWKQRKYCTIECSRLHQTEYVLSGEKHPGYLGKEITPRYIRQKEWSTKKYQDWRNTVFIRDNHTCQFCGKRGGDIQADHIKTWAEYPNLRYDIENGRTLCIPCHRTTFKFHRNQYSE